MTTTTRPTTTDQPDPHTRRGQRTPPSSPSPRITGWLLATLVTAAIVVGAWFVFGGTPDLPDAAVPSNGQEAVTLQDEKEVSGARSVAIAPRVAPDDVAAMQAEKQAIIANRSATPTIETNDDATLQAEKDAMVTRAGDGDVGPSAAQDAANLRVEKEALSGRTNG